MTRRLILTSAALAAFLTAGAPLAASTISNRDANAQAESPREADPMPPILTIGGHLVAVHTSGPVEPGGRLGVALFLHPEAPDPPAIRLWAGIKNGWGSSASRSEPVTGSHGLHVASVELPLQLPPHARLWIGLEPAAGRQATGSIALPGFRAAC